MKFSVFILFFSSLVWVQTAAADLYLELAAEGGGDALIETNTLDSISAGGGIKFAIGVQNDLSYDGSSSLRLTVGYLSDAITAYNGEADFDTLTFDAMFVSHSGPHSLGIGATFHSSPQYSDVVDGFQPEVIKFDDAVGLVFQYGYHFVSGLELGVRYIDLDYQSGSHGFDASGLGVFLSNGF